MKKKITAIVISITMLISVSVMGTMSSSAAIQDDIKAFITDTLKINLDDYPSVTDFFDAVLKGDVAGVSAADLVTQLKSVLTTAGLPSDLFGTMTPEQILGVLSTLMDLTGSNSEYESLTILSENLKKAIETLGVDLDGIPTDQIDEYIDMIIGALEIVGFDRETIFAGLESSQILNFFANLYTPGTAKTTTTTTAATPEPTTEEPNPPTGDSGTAFVAAAASLALIGAAAVVITKKKKALQ